MPLAEKQGEHRESNKGTHHIQVAVGEINSLIMP